MPSAANGGDIDRIGVAAVVVRRLCSISARRESIVLFGLALVGFLAIR
jgi:hypothetical protein